MKIPEIAELPIRKTILLVKDFTGPLRLFGAIDASRINTISFKTADHQNLGSKLCSIDHFP